MTDKSIFSDKTQKLIMDLTSIVSAGELEACDTLPPEEFRYHSPEAIQAYERYTRTRDNSLRMHTMLDIWKEQQTDERKLRSIYAGWMLLAFFIELLAANTGLFLLGFRIIRLDNWIADIFFVSVFSQAASMIYLILKYLFPDKSSGLLELLERL